MYVCMHAFTMSSSAAMAKQEAENFQVYRKILSPPKKEAEKSALNVPQGQIISSRLCFKI